MRKERRGSPRGPATTEAVAGGVWPQPQGHLESWDLEEAGSIPGPPAGASRGSPPCDPSPPASALQKQARVNVCVLSHLAVVLVTATQGTGTVALYVGTVASHMGTVASHVGMFPGPSMERLTCPEPATCSSRLADGGTEAQEACTAVRGRADRGGWGGVEPSELWAVLAPSEARVGTPALSCHRELLSV